MDKIIVYGTYMGFVQVISFVGGKWWNLTKDDSFMPMDFEGDNLGVSFHYLCQPGDTLMVKDLAGLMGAVADNPERELRLVMEERMRLLIENGVKFVDAPQTLNLAFRLSQDDRMPEKPERYGLMCEDGDLDCRFYFGIDDFETLEDACEFMDEFVGFFKSHGVTVNCKLTGTKDLIDKVSRLTYDVILEIFDED